MDLQSLNNDSLSAIVAYLNCSDALRFSVVVRSFHTIAKYHALHYVTLSSYGALVNFCRLMLSSMSHRLASILAIKAKLWIENEAEMADSSWLGPPPVPVKEYRATGALFADVLERANNLRTLTLNRAEVWMDYEPRIADAVIALRNLDELILRDVGPTVSRVIHRMQSTPRKLGIPEVDGSLFFVHTSFPLDDHLRLPFVSHLIVYGNMALPSVADLVRVFPNVRTLDLGSGWVKEPPVLGMEINWPKLEHLEGRPEVLTKWRNVTPVHSVRLTIDFDMSYHDNPKTLDGVRNAQPMGLAISFGSSADTTYWSDLASVSRRLRYLSLDAYGMRYSKHWQKDLKTSIAAIVPILASADIVCLKILCCPPEHKAADMQNIAAIDLAEYETCEAIRTDLPHAAASIPSLRYLSLDVYACIGEPRHGTVEHPLDGRTYWWQYDGPGTEKVARTIDPARGERIAAYLHSPAYDCRRNLK
ncbi:hypothetical protein EVJ58_g8384, partial [Rhodofomes roseus]